MMPTNIQRIYRELCTSKDTLSQTAIARGCGCSLSLVNKVVKRLEQKGYLHKPFRNRVAVLDFQGLVLYWALNRDIEDEAITEVTTAYGVDELEKKAASLFKDCAFSSFTAAKKYGVNYTAYNEVYMYVHPEKLGQLKKIRVGDKSKLKAIACADAHLYRVAKAVGGLKVVPLPQAFADLLSLNTWEAKCNAFRIAGVDKRYPELGGME